jgi:hypothetical protein
MITYPSARDGNFKYIHVAWIPAVHAGMTGFVTFVYNDESRSLGAKTEFYLHYCLLQGRDAIYRVCCLRSTIIQTR